MDPIAEWSAAQQRVVEIVSGIDDTQAERHVPACPDWTVRQLLSHMIGLDADVLAGDEPDDHNNTWTQRQVERRHNASVADLVAEWNALADELRAWMRDNGTRPLGDVIIHEQDLRGALHAPGARDTDGVAMIRDRMAERFGGRVTDLPGIELASPSWTWSSRSDLGGTRLEASDFDLARALVSRRSADQLRAWTTRGDVEPYLTAFAGLGPLPTRELDE